MIDCSKKQNFKNKVCLRAVGEAQFSIVIPKNDNSGKPIKKTILRKYINRVNDVFGGSTTVPTTKGCFFDKKKFFCEDGLQITGVRDFDTKYNKKLKKLNSLQRKKKMSNDYKKMRKIGKEAAKQLGQDSVMVIHDSIADASFVPGRFKSKLRKSKIGREVIFP